MFRASGSLPWTYIEDKIKKAKSTSTACGTGRREKGFPTADCMRIECSLGTYCIGSDKIGHFFQQGYMYWEIAKHFGASSGRDYAISFGWWTEGLPLAPATPYITTWLETRSFPFRHFSEHRLSKYEQKWGGWVAIGVKAQRSWPDTHANVAGMEFYENSNMYGLLKSLEYLHRYRYATAYPGPVQHSFDICNYISASWIE